MTGGGGRVRSRFGARRRRHASSPSAPVEELDADPRAAGAEVVDATGHAVHPRPAQLPPALRVCCAARPSRCRCGTGCEAYVDPAHKALTPEIAAAASLHCYAESVLAGTTSVMDMWRFMEGSADAPPRPSASGPRSCPTSPTARLRLLRDASSRTGGCSRPHRTAADGRVRTWVGLEHLLYCTRECFRDAAGAGRGVRHRHPHPLVGVDLGGAGVAEALRAPADRGVPPPRHPRPSARSSRTACGSTTARSSCWRRPAPRWPTARART